MSARNSLKNKAARREMRAARHVRSAELRARLAAEAAARAEAEAAERAAQEAMLAELEAMEAAETAA